MAGYLPVQGQRLLDRIHHQRHPKTDVKVRICRGEGEAKRNDDRQTDARSSQLTPRNNRIELANKWVARVDRGVLLELAEVGRVPPVLPPYILQARCNLLFRYGSWRSRPSMYCEPQSLFVSQRSQGFQPEPRQV